MLAQEIIRRKSRAQRLDAAEIQSFVRGLVDRSWSEGQIAAFAMAVCLRGMGRGAQDDAKGGEAEQYGAQFHFLVSIVGMGVGLVPPEQQQAAPLLSTTLQAATIVVIRSVESADGGADRFGR